MRLSHVYFSKAIITLNHATHLKAPEWDLEVTPLGVMCRQEGREPVWVPLSNVTGGVVEEEPAAVSLSCADCGFEAKTLAALKSHARAKHSG